MLLFQTILEVSSLWFYKCGMYNTINIITVFFITRKKHYIIITHFTGRHNTYLNEICIFSGVDYWLHYNWIHHNPDLECSANTIYTVHLSCVQCVLVCVWGWGSAQTWKSGRGKKRNAYSWGLADKAVYWHNLCSKCRLNSCCTTWYVTPGRTFMNFAVGLSSWKCVTGREKAKSYSCVHLHLVKS